MRAWEPKPQTHADRIRDKSDEELRTFIKENLDKRLPHYTKATHTFVADKLEDRTQIASSVEKFIREILQTQ